MIPNTELQSRQSRRVENGKHSFIWQSTAAEAWTHTEEDRAKLGGREETDRQRAGG